MEGVVTSISRQQKLHIEFLTGEGPLVIPQPEKRGSSRLLDVVVGGGAVPAMVTCEMRWTR